MDRVSRRKFLIASGVLGAAALADGAASVTWKALMDRANTDPLPLGNKILVVVTLYGGNDGLSTVIPYTDDTYHSARSALAYDPSDVLPIGHGLAFNPAMKGMHDLFTANKLAVVRGVGYPKPVFSHFSSMDIWQTGSPDSPITTGWIGRWLDATGDDPLRAVSIGATLPVMAIGAKTTASSLAKGPYQKLDPALAQLSQALAQTDPTDDTAESDVSRSFRSERALAAKFDPLLGATSGTSTTAKKGSPGAPNALQQQLNVVSRAISAGVPTKVWMVSLGGFDLHSKERTTQESLWKTVDTAVTAFQKDLAATPHGSDVVMMMHSEFGRRVQANSAQGTDHGSAAPVFVIGGGTKGGLYGEEPSLTDLDEGNLKYSVDFRAVYGELIATALDTDPHKVLNSVPEPMRFSV